MLSACSYTSQYRPPVDDRARAVWDRNTLRAVLATRPTRECDAAVTDAISDPNDVGIVRSYEYVPPRTNVAVIYAPIVWYAPFIAPVPIVPVPVLDEGNPIKSVTYLAAFALIVLPIVDIVVAAWDPEDDETSSLSIDTVNAYNDLARTEGSPCVQ